jgi:hypothetical protein
MLYIGASPAPHYITIDSDCMHVFFCLIMAEYIILSLIDRVGTPHCCIYCRIAVYSVPNNVVDAVEALSVLTMSAKT